MLVASLVLLCSLPVQAFASDSAQENQYAPYPAQYDEYVNLFFELPEQDRQSRDELIQRLSEFYELTRHRFVVVIVNSIYDYPGTANDSMETFADGLFESYGLRMESKDYDNNILLLISLQERRSFLKVGSGYIDSTQAEILQYNREHIEPLVLDGKPFQAATDNIPGVRRTLFGWIYEPRPFPWGDLYIAAGVIGILFILVALTHIFLRFTWRMSAIFVASSIFYLIASVVFLTDRHIYEHNDPKILRRLIAAYRNRDWR